MQITLADIGSAGGIHKRWKRLPGHISAVLFDPLDQSTGSPRDRYLPFAVADGPGRATLHVTKCVSMTSFLLPDRGLLNRFWDKPAHTEIVSSFEVPTDSLDRLMEANGITLDVLKVDVQGGEHAVLSGAGRVLREDLYFVELELSFMERYTGLRPFEEIVAMMGQHDFELIDIGRIKRYRHRNDCGVVNPRLGLGDRAGRIAFCDALFLKRQDVLSEQITSGRVSDRSDRPVKVILTLLAYGKADMAAWIFDQHGDQISPPIREALRQWFESLGGRRFVMSGLHWMADLCASKV